MPKREVIASNGYFQITKITYEGQEAIEERKRAEAERATREEAYKAAQEGMPPCKGKRPIKEGLPSALRNDFLESLSPEQEEELYGKALGHLRAELMLGLGDRDILPVPEQAKARNKLGSLAFTPLSGETSHEQFDALFGEILSFAPPQSIMAISLHAGYLLGAIAAGMQAHETAGGGGHSGKPRKAGPFKTAVLAVAEEIGTKDPEAVCRALEDEGLVEDLFCATPTPRIDLHLFEVDREEQTVAFTDRQGRDHRRSLKTVLNYLTSP